MLDFVDPRYYLFLPVAAFFVLALRARRLRVLALLALSWGFFLVAGGGAIVLLLATTVTDYVIGGMIHRAGDPVRRRALLAVGIVSSLALLVVAKYTNFLVDNANAVSALLGAPFTLPHGTLIPTLAISFYTFESISYLVDVHRRDVEPCASFADYAAFISFFPHLIAGPIVRAKDFLPQLHAQIGFKAENIPVGLAYIAFGLVQKLVIADTLAVFADRVFHAPAYWELGTLPVMLGVIAFGIQIYCDFAGYTHIAIGSAKLFNLDLPENFDFPYIATRPREFWRRWHITLSRWLRDYLYVPLGGSRNGKGRTYLNLMITMGLGGLWHGASWTFVVWGLFHGALLVADHAVDGASRAFAWVARPVRVAIAWLATQYLVFLGWLFFRAKDMTDLVYMARKWLFLDGFAWSLADMPVVPHFHYAMLVMLAFAVVGVASLLAGGLVERFARARPAAWGLAMGACALAIATLQPSESAPFIYFQF